ncbi:hypothetical protein JCM6882_009188 [Rhodosporidiobolus microsporus]
MNGPPIPAVVEANPPANRATLGSALNLAVVLDLHGGDLANRGMDNIRTNMPFLFTKAAGLAARIAEDQVHIGHDTTAWDLVQNLLLPTDALVVEFSVHDSDTQSGVNAHRLLECIQMEHHGMHGRQPNAPEMWTVPRATLKQDPRLVNIKCAVSTETELPGDIEHVAGQDRHLENYQQIELRQRLIPRLPSGFSRNPIDFFVPEPHLFLLDFMDGIAFGRGNHRHVAFFCLYLLGSHRIDLATHGPFRAPLRHAMRSLYLSLRTGGGEGMHRDAFRAIWQTSSAMPQVTTRFFEKQVEWHLALPVQSGTGGERTPGRLLRQYQQFYDEGVSILKVAIEGREKHPDLLPYASLGKAAYQPLARRAFA